MFIIFRRGMVNLSLAAPGFFARIFPTGFRINLFKRVIFSIISEVSLRKFKISSDTTPGQAKTVPKILPDSLFKKRPAKKVTQ
jgi:hypothetical protein